MSFKGIAAFGVALACISYFMLQYLGMNSTEMLGYISSNGLNLVGLGQMLKYSTADKLFTKSELADFKFKYLAIVGEIFDVTSGERHYGEEGHYNFFTGLDGTRAFVSGIFTEEGLIDDITGLPPSEIHSIEDWRLMYHKSYKYVGKLVGRYYDDYGRETAEKSKYFELLKRAANEKLQKKEFTKLYPPCNSEFSKSVTRVWCSNKSGGIQRAWEGVPRKLFTPGTNEFRCACVRTSGPPSLHAEGLEHNDRGDLDNPTLGEYPNCDPKSNSCGI